MSTQHRPITDTERDQLVAAATRAYENAYARYSDFQVGAAILLANGQTFTGCNVENASYGLTNCAERSAIFTAVSALGGDQVKVRAVAVVNRSGVPCSPCGACRQVLAEFGSEAEVFYLGESGIQRSTMRELLPDGFNSKSLG
jgi:cytidine deaminase